MPTRQEDEEILAAVRALQAGAGPDAFAPIARRYWRPLFTFFSNRPALRDLKEAAKTAVNKLLAAKDEGVAQVSQAPDPHVTQSGAQTPE